MKKIVRNIFIILNSREKKNFLLLALLDVVISILDIFFLLLLLYVINIYTDPNHVNTWGRAFAFLQYHSLLPVSVFFILFSLKNVAGFFISRAQYKFVYTVASRLSKDNLFTYFNGTYENYVNVDSSIHIRRISQQPIEFAHYVLRGFQQIISQSILITITIIAILIFNAVLFPLLLFVLIPPILLTGIVMKRKLNLVRKHTKTSSEKTLQQLQESISAFIESNIYGKKDFFSKRYYDSQNKLNGLLSDQQVIQNLPSRLMEIFAVFGLFMLILINTYTSNTNNIQVLIIGAFMAAAYKIIPGVVKILNSAGQIKTYEFTVTDLLRNSDATIKKENTVTAIRSVELKNISFGYQEERIIKNLSLQLHQGDLTGIAGISGKGKTTLINLLLGFLMPAEGTILINESVLANGDNRYYRNKIAYVKQQPFFIHDSILKNITLDHNYDHKRLSGVIEAAGLSDIINNSANRLNTVITENGKNFSGGQRQRIMLARALYKEFDLLVLDEPFSELDEAAEKCLLNYLKQIAEQGKIILLIAHSKTALSYCNKTVCLDE